MEFIKSEELKNKNIWVGLLKGKFVLYDNSLFFLYQNGYDELTLLELENGGIKNKNVFFANPKSLNIPSKWVVDNDKIAVGDGICVDLKTKSIVNHVCSIEPERHKSAYEFGEYTVLYNEASNYTSKKNDKTLWNIAVRGYLYTGIQKYGNDLIFGTDGMGGHFCIVDIESGEIKLDINTGGTNHFCVHNGSAYLLNVKKNTALCVSLCNYNITDEVKLYGKAAFESSLYLFDDILYVSTFKNENKYTLISSYKIDDK